MLRGFDSLRACHELPLNIERPVILRLGLILLKKSVTTTNQTSITMQTIQNPVTDRRLFLKVKLINLADEARTIRKMERKGGPLREELRNHRTGIVRHESRHTQIAYGFLRGRSLAQIGAGKRDIDWKKVESMATKYGPREHDAYLSQSDVKKTAQRLAEWKSLTNIPTSP